jgi:hypothetical protein
MNHRALHGLLGSLILAGLLIVGLAFTYDNVNDVPNKPFHMTQCGENLPVRC